MHERMVEWTIQSSTHYTDPFNDVEIDVIFSKDGQSWRVPTFWRGGRQWSVRFAPPTPGDYSYRLECNDPNSSDVHGREGRVRISAYTGSNELLRRGMLRVSGDRRHFEHADGTPFYWLADTWWMGLSDRLSWPNFQTLCADRKSKGYTVVQLVAGLVPPEEVAPLDCGFANEGGTVWTSEFQRINPKYFDYVDRRILFLLEQGIVPAIVGAWSNLIGEMGAAKLRQHWRYIVARYGAYPVFWIVGGEVIDPPAGTQLKGRSANNAGEWTDIARYVRNLDPYHHPLTVHEVPAPLDTPLQDESLLDFDLFQSSHFGWASAAIGIGQITSHRARTFVTKPVVQGEIGYERLFATHFEDFQRYAFWTTMLNGAAGFTYGADGLYEAYTADKPLHRLRWSFLNWEEGMKLPGGYQVGLGAKLLRRFRWWQLEPHPEWVTPCGKTFLEPQHSPQGLDLGLREMYESKQSVAADKHITQLYAEGLGRDWCEKHGDFRAPYAAGIPGEVRIVYVPSLGFSLPRTPPTLLGLESGVRYHAYLWEPSLGMRVNLGRVERTAPGAIVFNGMLSNEAAVTSVRDGGPDGLISVLGNVSEKNAVARVTVKARHVRVVMRYQDADNYVAAVYSSDDEALWMLDRREGADGRVLGKISVAGLGATFTLSVEVREAVGVAAVSDGERTFTTPIVDLRNLAAGSAGVISRDRGELQSIGTFELRRGAEPTRDEPIDRKLYDAEGRSRGELIGPASRIQEALGMPGWDDFGRRKHVLLDAYRPELPPACDWIIVLETDAAVVRR